MNDTKEVLSYYERRLAKQMRDVLSQIEKDGFTEETYTKMRFLEQDLTAQLMAKHFVSAWHSDEKAS